MGVLNVDRLQRYTQDHVTITIGLATLLLTALGYLTAEGKPIPAWTLGSFALAIAMFAVSGFCGGFFAAKISEMPDAMPSDLLGKGTALGRLRSGQHWALWLGIVFAASGGVAYPLSAGTAVECPAGAPLQMECRMRADGSGQH